MRYVMREHRNSGASLAALAALTLVLTAPPLAGQQQGASPLPEGSCAVIVASRRNLDEARAFQTQNGHLRFGHVFRAPNGAYAISLGHLPQDRARGWIDREAAAGRIPDDSFCSTARGFQVVLQPPGAPNPPAPEEPGQFQADLLHSAELHALQARLALLGHYDGLIDGNWGPMSQGALTAWRAGRGQPPTDPRVADAVAAFLVSDEAFDNAGWTRFRLPDFGLSLLLPINQGNPQRGTGGDVRFQAAGGTPRLVVTTGDEPTTERRHETLLGRHAGGGRPYRLRGESRWVSQVRTGDGDVYLRSERQPDGQWSSVTVTGNLNDGSTRLAIAGIGPLDAPEPSLPADGTLTAEVVEARADRPPPPEPGEDEEPEEPNVALGWQPMGAGFFVSTAGHVLTHGGVVQACRDIRIDGQRAQVVGSVPDWDLALLRLPDMPQGRRPLPLSAAAPQLNTSVTAAGFVSEPERGQQGSFHTLRMNIWNAPGQRENDHLFQLSAPIPSGALGGPIVDAQGRVIGVGVAADTPQARGAQRGAAVTGDVARSFLLLQRLRPQAPDGGAGAAGLTPAQLAQRMAAGTVAITCAP